MGDKLLNRFFLLFIVIMTIVWAIPNKQLVNTLVEEIKPDRIGLNPNTLAGIRNPFVLIKTSDKALKSKLVKRYSQSRYIKPKVHFKLYATLNKSAKINNRWVALNGKLHRYTLKQITKEYVVMQKGSAKPITIYLNRKNKKINLMTK